MTSFIAKITAKTLSSGKWLYSWEEQIADPNTFDYDLANPARRGSATSSPAYELNNTEVEVDTLVSMYQRGHYRGQLVYEFIAPDGSESNPATTALNEHQVGFGSNTNELTGNNRFTYQDGLIRLLGYYDGGITDQSRLYLDNLDPSLHSEIHLRRALYAGSGAPSNLGSYAILGELLFDAYIGGAWTNKGFLRGERSTDTYHRILLSALASGLDAYLELANDTGASPATWGKLSADIVKLGKSGGSLALEPVTSAGVLIGTLAGSNSVRGVTVGTGLSYDAAAGTLDCTVTGGSGTVTSVDLSGGSTGLTTSGGPVTGSGTITLGGTLAIGSGGTGQTTAAAALDALLPTQTGNSGKVLTTNGTTHSWGSASLDINGMTAAVPDLEDDTLPFYDSTASANRKAVLAYHLGFNDAIGGRMTNYSGNPEGAEYSYASSFSIYYTPFRSNRIVLDDGTGLRLCTFTETAIPRVGGLAMIDVFAYWNGSAVAFECLDWASTTARATALAFHPDAGFRVKSGDNTRRYIGSVYSLASNPTVITYDWRWQRYLWNAYNRVLKKVYTPIYATSGWSWTYSGTAWRCCNNNTNHKIEVVTGIETDVISLRACVHTYFPNAGSRYALGIGYDSSTADSSDYNGNAISQTNSVGVGVQTITECTHRTGIGLHTYYAIEATDGATTWSLISGAGSGGPGTIYDSGMTGVWLC